MEKGGDCPTVQERRQSTMQKLPWYQSAVDSEQSIHENDPTTASETTRTIGA